jgi:DNA-binding transcriptional ArsR family regulator
MKLSKRMKLILFILCKNVELTRNDIVTILEKKRGSVFVKSRCSNEFVLVNKTRVSYDRTLKRLRELELVEGGFPEELSPFSPYKGTLWQGFLYRLTPKGKLVAQKLKNELLESVEYYSLVLHETKFS